MKSFIFSLIAALLMTMSCNNSVSYDEARAENMDQFDDAEKLEDAKFLVEVKSWNMLAIQLLRLAADSGYSSVVVNLAQQSLPQHEQLDKELRKLAKRKDISMPDELSPEHQMLLGKLNGSGRQNFDNTFSRIIMRINEENKSLFTTKATQASDPDIRAFAARKLDLLRAHSKLLSSMESQLLNTSE